MTETRFPNAPPNILQLPVDKRGFSIPWFVHIDEHGQEDFRVIGADRIVKAVRQQLCWICGKRLQSMKAFTIGPMCALNRISAEPPSHPMCADFAARHCPFLSQPLAKRNERNMPQEATSHEMHLPHNPGVTLVWWTQRFVLMRDRDSALFEIGPPRRCTWYCEGREATRDEILAAINKGLPYLRKAAESDGEWAMEELQRRLDRALQLLPKAA